MTGGYMTDRLRRWRSLTDGPLLVIGVGTLPLLLLELGRDELQRSDRQLIDVVNLVVLAAYVTDYIVELVLATNRRQFVRSEWTSALIVIAQLIALAPALAGLSVLRVLRAGGVWRAVATVARIGAIGGSLRRDARRRLRRRAVGWAFGTAGFTWLSSAVGFTLAERSSPTHHSFVDAMWWGLTTMTTVGYGDVYPTTPAGRLIAVVTMLVGIGTLAVVTGKVAEFFLQADRPIPKRLDENETHIDYAADVVQSPLAKSSE
jgi:voltage-gated potassium channel